MATIRKIKKDGGLPDYYYVMPNQDRIDIMVIRPEIYETLDEVRAAAKKMGTKSIWKVPGSGISSKNSRWSCGPKTYQYTCVLPAPHFSKTFSKMNEMRAYFDEHFES